MDNGATVESGKYLFRSANVWWRCTQYLVISLVARCLDIIYVCIWRIFVFMSGIVTVWGVCGDVCFVAAVVKDSVFLSLGVLKYVCVRDVMDVVFSVDLYSTQHTLLDYICVATSIRELCESRDSEYTNFFDRNESRKLIDFLCTTLTNSYSLFCMYLSATCYSVIFLPTAFICICFNLSILCCTS